MAADWYYARNNERHGPLEVAKLRSLAQEGWLGPDDLVWHAGMVEWIPARRVSDLFGAGWAGQLQELVGAAPPPAPESRKKSRRRRRRKRGSDTLPAVDWGHLLPRHLLAGGGAFMAALGIAFAIIVPSRLALACLVGGLFLMLSGMYAEVASAMERGLIQAGRAWFRATQLRQESQRLKLERQRLQLEVERTRRRDA